MAISVLKPIADIASISLHTVLADSSGAFEQGLLLILGAIEVVDGARLRGGGGAGLAGLL
jgi:hypothetical protein